MPHSPKPFAHSEATEISPKLNIAVLGPLDLQPTDALKKTAVALAKEIAKQGHTILIQTQAGVAETVAAACSQVGGCSIGFSPAESAHEHYYKFMLPTEFFSTLIYANTDYWRLQRMVYASADMVVFICGQSSPVAAVVEPLEESKPIGIMTSGAGQTTEVAHLVKMLSPREPGIVFENRPRQLISKLQKIALG